MRFAAARSVFRDPFAIELLDDRMDYRAERYILFGMAHGSVLVAVHTERQSRNRIISARKAEPNEQKETLIKSEFPATQGCVAKISDTSH